MQRQAQKRPCPFPDRGEMTRSKPSSFPTVFLSSLAPDDRKAMERAASILQIPVVDLVASPPRSDGGGLQSQQQSVGSRAIDLDHNDYRSDSTGDEQSNDNNESNSDEDVTPWQSAVAEFNDADDDIAGRYDAGDPWMNDFPLLSPEAILTQHPSENTSSASPGRPQRVSLNIPQNSVQSHLQAGLSPLSHHVSSFVYDSHGLDSMAPEKGALNPKYHSWEIIESFSGPQPSNPVQLDTGQSDWAVVGRPGEQVLVSPRGHNYGDAVRFVPVNPLQPQAPSRQRRGPFKNRERQEETSRTRDLKACVRCRMQKIRCTIIAENPGGICGTCLDVSKQKVHYLPCLRYRLTECTLYRTGKAPGLEFTFRWPVMKLKDISDWASPQLRTILVQSDICEVPLKLVVREFVPIPHKDEMHRSWMDQKRGIKKFKKTTPYAIANMRNAVEDMREYVTANIFKCVDFFLQGSDTLVKETYQFARKHMQRVESDEERKLLGNFFRLWFAIRRTATTEHIVGEDTLDMNPETDDRSYPLFGKVPLPSVMIQQLDMILTLGILDPLRKQVLEDFQKLALVTNPRNWMTIYLITFMSLHSCAKITDENYRNARKHGLLRRYAIPNFVAERHHSANVFLSHYHYRTESCNPFKQDWKRRHTTPFAHMSVEEIQFLERTKALLQEREPIIKTNNEHDLYEHELYFISQMFEENWQPRETTIDYVDGTVNNVGLKRYAEGAEAQKV